MSSLDVATFIGNRRITDYSFVLARALMTAKTSTSSHSLQNVNVTTLSNLYRFLKSLCVGSDALYPMSNWQPHRLCVMSAIAVYLNHRTWVMECEQLAIDWLRISDCRCCPAKSQDFHYRDSCAYVVYGWWALVQTFVHLQSITQTPYRRHFSFFLGWCNGYQKRRKTHLEFVNSNIPADRAKPTFNKPFDPAYIENFMRVYRQLRN